MSVLALVCGCDPHGHAHRGLEHTQCVCFPGPWAVTRMVVPVVIPMRMVGF